MNAQPREDGLRYWPRCPECDGAVGLYGITDGEYLFRCNYHGHESTFSLADLLAGQEEWGKFWRKWRPFGPRPIDKFRPRKH